MTPTQNRKVFGILIFLALAALLQANVYLPAIISDHMVIQANTTIELWGWATPGEIITVNPGWVHEARVDTTERDARWSIQIDTPPAGGPYQIKIGGKNQIILDDVYSGEVWLASGSTPMTTPVEHRDDTLAAEISQANYPQLRFFRVATMASQASQLDGKGEWVVCSPETMLSCSAIAYFFGQGLHHTLAQPVGMVLASWPASPIEAWISPRKTSATMESADSSAGSAHIFMTAAQSSMIYNGMLAPLEAYRFAGVIWDQGAESVSNPMLYEQQLKTLIQDWRLTWGSKLPFHFVQLGSYEYDAGPMGLWLREVQRKSLQIPNTGMVVTSDLGDASGQYLATKKAIGQRLANQVLNLRYGIESAAASGPVFHALKTQGSVLRVDFDHAQGGLTVKEGGSGGFLIAGEDQVFHAAQAKVWGASVILSAPEVSTPVAVRLDWSNTAEASLFNGDGLPASCFRSDDWPYWPDREATPAP